MKASIIETNSRLVNRNVQVARARTSIRLEPELWDGLKEVCQRERWTESRAIEAAQTANPSAPRTSAIRCFILEYFRAASTEAGHVAANHGRVAN